MHDKSAFHASKSALLTLWWCQSMYKNVAHFQDRHGDAGDPDGVPVDRRIHQRVRKIDWLWYGLFVLALVGLYQFTVANPRWEWDVVRSYLFDRRVLAGLANTLILTAVASSLGLLIGLVVAACRMSANPVLRGAGFVYIWVIRATPTLAMLLFLFFLSALVPRLHLSLPILNLTIFDISTQNLISRFTAAIIGLAMYLGGYSAETFRGGLAAVDRGQREACKAMGMSDLRMMWHVVAPQAIRIIIPPLANELITMFKNTSLVTVIGYTELLTTVQLIYSTNFETIPLLTVACIWYLALTSLAMLGQSMLERHFGKGVRHEAS
jgi:polar amino acid transport system permease protein